MENPITSSPIVKPLAPEPSSATTPAKSLPWPDGKVAGNMWCNAPVRITASLGLMPAALNLDQHFAGPRYGAGNFAHLENVDAAV